MARPIKPLSSNTAARHHGQNGIDVGLEARRRHEYRARAKSQFPETTPYPAATILPSAWMATVLA
jgi:hypothetical protein